MLVRKFKPGDRVEHKSGGPVMEVIHYVVVRRPLVGKILSEKDVKCVWYENGERKTAILDQRVLIKSSKQVGLIKT